MQNKLKGQNVFGKVTSLGSLTIGSATVTNPSTNIVLMPGVLGLTGVLRSTNYETGGYIIFNSSTKKLNFYNGTAWEVVTSATT